MYDISGDDIFGDMDGDIDGTMVVGDDILGDIDGDDILGMLDISGDMDGTMVVGDLDGLSMNPRKWFARKKAKKQNMMKKALIQRKLATGALVNTLKPVAQRNLFLGLSQTGIAASALATITVQPQIPFKGYRLSVPAQFAPFFVLVDIRVGKDSQLVSPGAVPATSFSEVATGDNVSMDTASVGQLITVQVQNIDAAAAHDFRATLFGKSMLMGRC